MDEKQKEQLKRLKKQFGKKSLPIRIMESSLYDWSPGTRLTLLVIALGTRTNDEAWLPEDMPDEMKEDALGWCYFSQWRMALRGGKSESQIHRDIIRFEKDGVIEVERWRDSNNVNHDRYRIVESVIDENQRPEQKPTVARPNRYKEPRPKKGWFSSKNQPRRVSAAVAGMDE
jgi:hypothetical protein